MILFDLRCARDHVFEAWFRNSATYEAQAKAGAIACPSCGSRKVEKAPMAPRIGKGAGNKDESEGRHSPPARELAAMHRQLRELRSRVETNCDYVGDRFAEEARRIHYGEIARRDIYGEASEDEAQALNEEGVEFARIPWLPRHDG